MGPVRRGLTGLAAALLPAPALAQVCGNLRPGWTGGAVGPLQEAVTLFTSVPALILILATAVALRLRSQWGGLAVVVLWTALVSFVAMSGSKQVYRAATAEGCVGSPVLFITLVIAICIAIILYTAPLKSRSD